MRRPRIHKVFGIDHDVGLSNLFSNEGDFALDDVVRDVGQGCMKVIPSGPIPPNPAELLNDARMLAIIEDLGERFDYVIFDTPPTINVTDSAILSERIDGALLVVRNFTTDRGAVKRASELLAKGGAHLLGVVINGVDAPQVGGVYGQDMETWSWEFALSVAAGSEDYNAGYFGVSDFALNDLTGTLSATYPATENLDITAFVTGSLMLDSDIGDMMEDDANFGLGVGASYGF